MNNIKLRDRLKTANSAYYEMFGRPPQKRAWDDSFLQESMVRSAIEVNIFNANDADLEDIGRLMIINETIAKWKPFIDNGFLVGYKEHDKWMTKTITLSKHEWYIIFKTMEDIGIDLYSTPRPHEIRKIMEYTLGKENLP